MEGSITVGQQTVATPIALTIAGSDSGGGAGVQADLKAFSALGVYGASVITALTAQNTRTVSAVENVSVAMISAQIDAVFDDLAIGAIKIGMLSTPETIAAVAQGLAGCGIPIVLDPVMVAKSGAVLLEERAIEALITQLLPLATLITPNLPEAAQLLGTQCAETVPAMISQADALITRGAQAVLMKGGHADGAVCTDVLIQTREEPICLEAPRIVTRNTHGTGCTLSASIAAGLAKGLPLAQAVADAHAYLHAAIRAADGLKVGSGHGPVHHFHRQWGAA
ncbi:MAG: bifunctional hydroxymethylpyrimidine kinase/phosphomethylpyrimidine kinase [Pseudomonadota bacterium]